MVGKGPGWSHLSPIELFPDLTYFSNFIHRELCSNNSSNSDAFFFQRGISADMSFVDAKKSCSGLFFFLPVYPFFFSSPPSSLYHSINLYFNYKFASTNFSLQLCVHDLQKGRGFKYEPDPLTKSMAVEPLTEGAPWVLLEEDIDAMIGIPVCCSWIRHSDLLR
jgi:hypothetical protein